MALAKMYGKPDQNDVRHRVEPVECHLDQNGEPDKDAKHHYKELD